MFSGDVERPVALNDLNPKVILDIQQMTLMHSQLCSKVQ